MSLQGGRITKTKHHSQDVNKLADLDKNTANKKIERISFIKRKLKKLNKNSLIYKFWKQKLKELD